VSSGRMALSRRNLDLTPLERRILEAYAGGACRAEIGERVGLSERTVGNYLTIAKEKLGARNLAHAASLSLVGREPRFEH
jgi:two-component system response regulator DesR